MEEARKQYIIDLSIHNIPCRGFIPKPWVCAEDVIVYRDLKDSTFKNANTIEKHKKMKGKGVRERRFFIAPSDDIDYEDFCMSFEVIGGCVAYDKNINDNCFYSIIPHSTPIYFTNEGTIVAEKIISFKDKKTFDKYAAVNCVAPIELFKEKLIEWMNEGFH